MKPVNQIFNSSRMIFLFDKINDMKEKFNYINNIERTRYGSAVTITVSGFFSIDVIMSRSCISGGVLEAGPAA